jgi:hypothetical protein
MTDVPAEPGAWATVHTEHHRTGLWPLLLEGEGSEEQFSPWGVGELFPRVAADVGPLDPEELLAGWFAEYTWRYDDDTLSEAERVAITAPFGQRWPGLAPALPIDTAPASEAAEYAEHLLATRPSLRLGLVVADDGPHALAVTGWPGAANYIPDTSRLAAVLRSWEERYGTRVVAAGFGTLYLSVAAPPTTLDEALRIAAEHFALCPDNVWQVRKPYTLAAYAERLVGSGCWEFWWD